MLLWNLWLKWIFNIFSFLAFRGNRVLIVQEGDMHICILEIMRYRFSPSWLLLHCWGAVEKTWLCASEFPSSPGMNTRVKRSSRPLAASHRQPNACSCSAAAPPVSFSMDGVKIASSAWKKKKGRAGSILNWLLLNTDELCWNQFLFLIRHRGSLFALFSVTENQGFIKIEDPLVPHRRENRFCHSFCVLLHLFNLSLVCLDS